MHMATDPRPNRLIDETSPYLRQHATNPVDWYPWGEEALSRARREDRPIFLSIGYSACHWCHVMERESFEDVTIAGLMNDHFVSIKVDREERPDVDRIYMAAVQMITGSGGWPLSVFLTPDLKPFFGGTYFPPEDRHGHPGFGRVLAAVADAFRTRREEIEKGGEAITDRIRAYASLDSGGAGSAGGGILLSPGLINVVVANLEANFDPDHGGFGSSMKFPQPTNLQLLLRQWRRKGDLSALQMVRKTLDHMAAGGIYDHIGGGFHRYATEPRWLIPHFEKMLYDNALLAIAYIEAWQATGESSYARVAHETLDYLAREMLSPEGGFYSSQDADVGDDEGGFYVWTPDELREALGVEEADLFARAFGVDDGGNFDGRTILSRVKDDRLLADLYKSDPATIVSRLAAARIVLYETRDRRTKPGRDEKILADWNGFAITAFARGARALDEPHYARIAERAARFVLTRMVDPAGGTLCHSYKDGAARVPAFLSDHACLLAALIDLYEATGDPERLTEAAGVETVLVRDFHDEAGGGFYDTSARHLNLIARTREAIDGAIPSGNVMAIIGMIRLARITGRPEPLARAERALRAFARMIDQLPAGTTQLCLGLDLFLSTSQEVAIIGPSADERTRALRSVVDRRFLPHTVVLLGDGRDARGLAGLSGKSLVAGSPAAYVCTDFTCRAPVTTAEDLERALGGGTP
jgi:hypothetical protein